MPKINWVGWEGGGGTGMLVISHLPNFQLFCRRRNVTSCVLVPGQNFVTNIIRLKLSRAVRLGHKELVKCLDQILRTFLAVGILYFVTGARNKRRP